MCHNEVLCASKMHFCLPLHLNNSETYYLCTLTFCTYSLSLLFIELVILECVLFHLRSVPTLTECCPHAVCGHISLRI